MLLLVVVVVVVRRRRLGSPGSERASRSPSSLAPALTSTSPSALPSVCASEDVLGAGCGLLPRSPSLLPLRLPPAFSGRAAGGCQSGGRAIRLRAGSGPAPSVFLIKEAAAETRGEEQSAAAPGSGGAAAVSPSAAAGSKLRQLPPGHHSPTLGTSAPGCAGPPVRNALEKESPQAPPGRAAFGRLAPARGRLRGKRRKFLFSPDSPTPVPHT